jgi:hypothetical protein
MFRVFSIFSMAFAVCLCFGAASADAFDPVRNGAGLTLRSEPADGKTATWKTGLAGINAVRAGLTVQRLGYDPYKTPKFSIVLSGGGRQAVLRIFSFDFRPPMLVRTELWVGDTFLSQQPFAKPLGLNEQLDLAIEWTAAGKVTVTAVGVSQTLNLNAVPETLEIVAEVGAIRFDPLEVGRVGRVGKQTSSFSYGL